AVCNTHLLHYFPTRRSSDLSTTTTASVLAVVVVLGVLSFVTLARRSDVRGAGALSGETVRRDRAARAGRRQAADDEPAVTAAERSEEHTSELQSRENLVCRR